MFLKNFILCLTISACSSNLFAADVSTIQVKTGSSVEIDVADLESLVKITFVIQSPTQNDAPQVVVLENAHGFECQLKYLTNQHNRFAAVGPGFEQAWNAYVNWTPGADYSYCDLEITQKYSPPTRIRLFMNY